MEKQFDIDNINDCKHFVEINGIVTLLATNNNDANKIIMNVYGKDKYLQMKKLNLSPLGIVKAYSKIHDILQ